MKNEKWKMRMKMRNEKSEWEMKNEKWEIKMRMRFRNEKWE